jgi:hypothetical protein
MKPVGEIGLKITSAQREYFRYTGASAELERRGAGSSRPEVAWVCRSRQLDRVINALPKAGAEDGSQRAMQ